VSFYNTTAVYVCDSVSFYNTTAVYVCTLVCPPAILQLCNSVFPYNTAANSVLLYCHCIAPEASNISLKKSTYNLRAVNSCCKDELYFL